MSIEQLTFLLSALALVGTTILGILTWRNNRHKPVVDMAEVASDVQTIAEKALDGQLKLTKELEELKKSLHGTYEIRVTVSFFPALIVHEASMKQLSDCQPSETIKPKKQSGLR